MFHQSKKGRNGKQYFNSVRAFILGVEDFQMKLCVRGDALQMFLSEKRMANLRRFLFYQNNFAHFIIAMLARDNGN